MSEVRGHAPHPSKYKWGYLHEALEVDGAHLRERLITPLIDRDAHALFLKQIADFDPFVLLVLIATRPAFISFMR